MICLDTHAFHLWLSGDKRLPAAVRRKIDRSRVFISCVTLWEMAQLSEEGRIKLDLSIREFLEMAVAWEELITVEITPSIAARAAKFGPLFPRDPMDRLITSTAIELGVPLATSDEQIAASGVVEILWD